MKVFDLQPDQFKVGLRVKGLATPGLEGTVVEIDESDDNYAWLKWDNQPHAYGGFYNYKNCRCEVVLDENGEPVYHQV